MRSFWQTTQVLKSVDLLQRIIEVTDRFPRLKYFSSNQILKQYLAYKLKLRYWRDLIYITPIQFCTSKHFKQTGLKLHIIGHRSISKIPSLEFNDSGSIAPCEHDRARSWR